MLNEFPPELREKSKDWWAGLAASCPEIETAACGAPDLAEALRRAATLSDFVAETCARDPRMAAELIQSGDIKRPYPKGEMHTRVQGLFARMNVDDDPGLSLRKLRAREMLRIAVRDLSGHSDFYQSTRDLSDLAESCVSETLALLYRRICARHGTPTDASGHPMNMVVFALGKLGAGELNFSSDIDLMFAYPDVGSTRGTNRPMDNGEFFTRLSRRFLEVFGQKGGPGNLFRVDLRLRPFGENGPLITSFNAMEDYYVGQGREWERYALIKARPIAGDIPAGEAFLQRLSPFVYRRYLDYGVFDALRDMKRMIEDEVRRKGLYDNIKLGAGGIREVEFFAQVFQLIRGGVDADLRIRGLMDVLSVLDQKALVPSSVCRELHEAYLFLRQTENRIQAFSDRQTHDLPSDPADRLKLALSMGYPDRLSFEADLASHRNRVNQHFKALLSTQETEPEDDEPCDLTRLWLNQLEADEAETILVTAGLSDAKACLRLLDYLKNDPGTRALSRTGRMRLNHLMPLLLSKTGHSQDPDRVLARLVDLVKTIERRTSYISLLIENPMVLSRLVDLAGESPWMVSYLSSHPMLLDELIALPGLREPFTHRDLARQLTRHMEGVAAEDQEQVMEQLTVFKLTRTFKVAAAELSGHLPLMAVSESLSCLADVMVETVMGLGWAYLTDRHGFPARPADRNRPLGFAVLGYGKLGGLELGYGSDLDLVFLYGTSEGRTEGERPIDVPHFYARMGQRTLHVLSTPTRAGKMYEIDLRLRPSGSSGPVVSSIAAYRSYLKEKAWTFELQSLVRARAVCGDPELIGEFSDIRMDILCTRRDIGTLKKDIRDMRTRLADKHAGKSPESFHLKHDSGGIIDIEFLVQYLVLAHAWKHRDVARFSDNIRQLEALDACGVIPGDAALFLKEAYLSFRKEVHRLDLQELPHRVCASEVKDLRNGVTALFQRYLKELT